MRAARSHLYVPGDRTEMLAKAAVRGADALIIDLEDAVAPSAKAAARETVAAYLAQSPPAGDASVDLWVRINPGEPGMLDTEAVVTPALSGICLAKTESTAQVAALGEVLGRLEDERGIPRGAIGVAPLLESAAAILRAAEIAAAPRVTRLQIGEADLCSELGVEPGPGAPELLAARSQVVLASAAAGIEPPVGPVSIDFTDLDALRESTIALRRMGYRGRAAVHPAQLPVINAVFTPTPEELARARRLVARYEESIARGDGVFTDEAGRMIDLAVVRAAQRTLATAR